MSQDYDAPMNRIPRKGTIARDRAELDVKFRRVVRAFRRDPSPLWFFAGVWVGFLIWAVVESLP